MRCFIGIEMESRLKEPIKSIQDDIREFAHATFVNPDNLHFTLAFLGEVDEKNLGNIKDSVSSVVKHLKKTDIEVGGLGVFPNKKFIRIVWVGAYGMEDINKAFRSVIKYDKNPVPHVTLARIKNMKNKKKMLDYIEANEALNIGRMTIKEIKLKKSVLTPVGPVYSNIKTFELK
jgi:2'-5' RNA ligase